MHLRRRQSSPETGLCSLSIADAAARQRQVRKGEGEVIVSVFALREMDIGASRQHRQRLAEFSLLDHNSREVVQSYGEVRMCWPQHALIQFQRSAPILLGTRPVLLEIRNRAQLVQVFRNLGLQPPCTAIGSQAPAQSCDAMRRDCSPFAL